MKRSTRTKKRSSANTKSKNQLNQRTARKAGSVSTKPILIVAGEESGDILGGAISREILKKKKLSLWGTGGHRMQAAGVEIFLPAERLATIGFWEAAKNYRRLVKIIDQIVSEALKRGVKDAWLIDFPGFNLVLAKKLKAQGVHCTMIVSPTVWAWKYKRVFKIRERFERVLCLYDFEPAIYEKIGVEAHYIGHPLTTETQAFREKFKKIQNPLRAEPQLKKVFQKKMPVVAIMPGSRPAEIHHHTERILSGVREFQKKQPEVAFILPAANEKIYALLEAFSLPPNTYLTRLSAPYVLHEATAAIACSGTVTLECALFGVPHLILYRSSWLSYGIFKGVIKIPYIGMVNVLAGKFVAQEFLQHRLTATNIAAELGKIMHDTAYRNEQKKALQAIAARLTAFEPAKRAAQILIEKLTI